MSGNTNLPEWTCIKGLIKVFIQVVKPFKVTCKAGFPDMNPITLQVIFFEGLQFFVIINIYKFAAIASRLTALSVWVREESPGNIEHRTS